MKGLIKDVDEFLEDHSKRDLEQWLDSDFFSLFLHMIKFDIDTLEGEIIRGKEDGRRYANIDQRRGARVALKNIFDGLSDDMLISLEEARNKKADKER